MPRPGPRPYECVRRAWHSDRHQPIRGSLIQEIFRVVNEIHCSATKKNKEWQEKLPVVVLRAEEIMYSKANSEAEYMDLKTLWDRTNDAINTIIRRDESIETGEFLQPCIEAALNLGCTPRKASRSQRNTNPGLYLSPGTQEHTCFSSGTVHNLIQTNHRTNSQCIANYSNFIKPTIANLTHSGSEAKDLVVQKNNVNSNKHFFATDNVPLSNINQCLPMENYPTSRLWSVYPLYHGSCLEPQHGFGILPKSVPGILEPVNVCDVQNVFFRNQESSVKISQTDLMHGALNPQANGCDLSLRLGYLSAPLPSVEERQLKDVKDVYVTHEGSKVNDPMPQMDKEFSFFTRVNMDDSLDFHSNKLSEHLNEDVTMKKRKLGYGHPVDEQKFRLEPNLQCNHLTGRMKSAGL